MAMKKNLPKKSKSGDGKNIFKAGANTFDKMFPAFASKNKYKSKEDSDQKEERNSFETRRTMGEAAANVVEKLKETSSLVKLSLYETTKHNELLQKIIDAYHDDSGFDFPDLPRLKLKGRRAIRSAAERKAERARRKAEEKAKKAEEARRKAESERKAAEEARRKAENERIEAEKRLKDAQNKAESERIEAEKRLKDAEKRAIEAEKRAIEAEKSLKNAQNIANKEPIPTELKPLEQVKPVERESVTRDGRPSNIPDEIYVLNGKRYGKFKNGGWAVETSLGKWGISPGGETLNQLKKMREQVISGKKPSTITTTPNKNLTTEMKTALAMGKSAIISSGTRFGADLRGATNIAGGAIILGLIIRDIAHGDIKGALETGKITAAGILISPAAGFILRGAAKSAMMPILATAAAKLIPGVGLLATFYSMAVRLFYDPKNPDWVGAGLDLVSGIAIYFGPIGAAISIGITVASLARDIYAIVYGVQIEQDTYFNEKLALLEIYVKEALVEVIQHFADIRKEITQSAIISPSNMPTFDMEAFPKGIITEKDAEKYAMSYGLIPNTKLYNDWMENWKNQKKSGVSPIGFFTSNMGADNLELKSLTFDATKITIDAEEFLMTNNNLGYGGGAVSPGMKNFGAGSGFQNASYSPPMNNFAAPSAAGRVDAPSITSTPGIGLGRTDTGPNLPAKDIIDFFVSQGWTPEQAAGIAGNLQQESSLDHTQSTVQENNGVEYYGLAQWSPERQANFKKLYGKDIRQSTALEQLQFIQDELSGKYKRVAEALRQETTPEGAAKLFNEKYEVGSEVEKRMGYGKDFFSQYSNQGSNLNNLSRNQAAQQQRNRNIEVPGQQQNNNQNGMGNMSPPPNPGNSRSYGESAANRIIELTGA